MRAHDWVAAALIAALALTVQAGTTTTVDLVHQETGTARVALPSIEVRVDGIETERAQTVATALSADLALRAITREPSRGETATYALAVVLPAAEGTTQRFVARLVAASGEVVWIVEGVTRSEDGPVADLGLRSLAANVFSALVRDGWVQSRLDPNDPPPPPPAVRRSGP